MKSRIHEARRVQRSDGEINPDGKYVLYWMQQALRTRENHALEHALEWGRECNLPVLVVFGLMDDYPEANARHYAFLLDGLRDVARNLTERGIGFACAHGHPADVALDYARRAALLITDKGYLRHARQWRQTVADEAPCRVLEVETDLVVPIETVSDKREFAARTLRPKINRLLSEFNEPLGPGKVDVPADRLKYRKGLDVSDPGKLLRKLKLDTSVGPVSLFPGGEEEGRKSFRDFLDRSLDTYAENRNQPQTDDVSHMSKFLHFGQVSPLWLLQEVQSRGDDDNVQSYVEELVVRRELAFNYVYYTDNYDAYDSLPDWARKTLQDHAGDQREHTCSRDDLVAAETHDPYWNAAMIEMRDTGYMHNYMRMYWGKKILEWTADPQEAFATALYLNNKYFIDGRDPNSYTGVTWCFGNHDRPWTERPIFGKVRYMNAAGLQRKAKPDAYVEKVNRLAAEAG